MHHGHVGAVLPQIGADIVGGIVGSDDDAFLPGEPLAAPVLARMELEAPERVRAGKARGIGETGHAGGQNELRGIERYLLPVSPDADGPTFHLGIVTRGQALG